MPLLTVWKSGNSLVVTIPADMARNLNIQEHTTFFAHTTASGAISLRRCSIKDTRRDPYRPKRYPKQPP